jgi:hypothetical protein
MQHQLSSMSTGWRHPLWLALLVAASVAFSLGFACAVPLAAFGAAAALTLSRRNALFFIGAVWLANQIVGYAMLGYPWTVHSLAWGAALGVVAVLATLAARWAVLRLEGAGQMVVPFAAFVAAFAVYEGALLVVAVALLGGTEDFTLAIIGRIFAINAVAMVGLLVLNRVGAVVGVVAAPRLRLSTMERHP